MSMNELRNDLALALEQRSYGKVAFVAEQALAQIERQDQPVELEAVHVGLTADQEIRAHGMRLAVASYGTEVDTASREDIAEVGLYLAEVIATGKLPADPAPATGEQFDFTAATARVIAECDRLQSSAQQDIADGPPGRLSVQQAKGIVSAVTRIRAAYLGVPVDIGALLAAKASPAPAHSTASEGPPRAVGATEPAVGTSVGGTAE